MKNLFWNIFEKSGDINAFMAYKEYNKKFEDFNDDDNNIIDEE